MSDLYQIFFLPFLGCIILTGIHCYLGLHIISRGVIFVDLSLAQLAAFGSSLALLFHFEYGQLGSYFMGLGFAFAGAAVFSMSRRIGERVPLEAIIGIVYAVTSAASIIILSQTAHGFEKIKTMLDGSILFVSSGEIIKMFAIYLVIGILHFVFRRQFLLISLDINSARKEGLRIGLWDFIFYATFGVVVTSSVQIGGVLLIFSYLVIPATCAFLLADGIVKRLIIGWTIGIAASVIGLLASYYVNIGDTQGLPTGSSVVCVFGLILIAVIIYRWLVKKKQPCS